MNGEFPWGFFILIMVVGLALIAWAISHDARTATVRWDALPPEQRAAIQARYEQREHAIATAGRELTGRFGPQPANAELALLTLDLERRVIALEKRVAKIAETEATHA